MTILEAPVIEGIAPLELTWSNPDANLWVASARGDFAGMIEFSGGRFVVTDATGTVVATETSIPAAQDALASGVPRPNGRDLGTGMNFKPPFFLNRSRRTLYRRNSGA